MLELLVLKNLHRCTSQRVRRTFGARVTISSLTLFIVDGRTDGGTVGRTDGSIAADSLV